MVQGWIPIFLRQHFVDVYLAGAAAGPIAVQQTEKLEHNRQLIFYQTATGMREPSGASDQWVMDVCFTCKLVCKQVGEFTRGRLLACGLWTSHPFIMSDT